MTDSTIEATGQQPLWGLPGDFPWGLTAMVEIPVLFWSTEWLAGVRSKTYIGMICSHHDPLVSKTCVQPWNHSQAVIAKCVPFDAATAKVTVLPGKPEDY